MSPWLFARPVIVAALLVVDGLLWYAALARKVPLTSPRPLTVAVNIAPSSEPLILARNAGELQEALVHVVEMNWSGAAMRALGNQAVDAAVLSLDEVLRLRENGLDIRIVLVLDVSAGADALMARPTIRSIAELRDKAVGVEMRSAGLLLLSRALRDSGLTLDEVRVVPMNLAETDSAWQENGLDAVVSAEPWLTHIANSSAIRLFDSSQMGGSLCHVLAVKPEALTSKAEPIRLLVQSHFRWREQLLNPSSPPDLSAVCRREGVTPAAFQQALRKLELLGPAENRHWLSGKVPALRAKAQALSDYMVKEKLLNHAPPLETLVDARFVEDVP